MFTLRKKLFMMGALGGALYTGNTAYKHFLFTKTNNFVNHEIIDDLKNNQRTFALGDSSVLMSHKINENYSKNKKRVLIIGGGLIGSSTAYELSKDQDKEVILLEKHSGLAQETSYANGTLICPSLIAPWTSRPVLRSAIESFITPEYKLSINPLIFLETQFFQWAFNYSMNKNKPSVEEAYRKQCHLALEGLRELKEIDKTSNLSDNLDTTTEGCIMVHKSRDNLKGTEYSKSQKAKFGIQYNTISKEEALKIEPTLQNTKFDFECCDLNTLDINGNSLKTTNLFGKLAQENGSSILTGCEVQRFLIDNDSNDIRGVVTNQGAILCDEVIVACGYQSKNMLQRLNVDFPLLPVQGYSVTVQNPNYEKYPLKHTIGTDQGIFIAPLKDKLRISGLADFGYHGEFNPKRVEFLKKVAKQYVGDFDDNPKLDWTGIRPLSPDDVPTISKIPKFNNLYVNAGHGAMGLTFSLGSAKVMKQIINNNASKQIKNDYSYDRFGLFGGIRTGKEDKEVEPQPFLQPNLVSYIPSVQSKIM